MSPRVITGVGVACALGIGREEVFQALAAGPVLASTRSPAPVTSFDATSYAGVHLLEVPAFDPARYLGDKGLRTLDRLTKLLVVAARLCLADAGLKNEGAWRALGPDRVGLCCSNAYGSLEAITELDRVAVLEDARYINPAKFPNTVSNSASGYVSIWEDLRALNVTVSDGNCGALDAVSCADVLLSTGRAEAILTGGGEAMSEALYLAFRKLGAVDAGLLGEAAAFLSLETRATARGRGADVLGEIVGYGTAFVPPAHDGLLGASRVALERAIAQALEDAEIQAREVDVVASGLSKIRAFDEEELAGIRAALGDVAVAAPKLVFGETLGAGGALGVVAALGWLAGSPPSPLVRGAALRDGEAVQTVLVTSVGYYGNASAVVVRRSGHHRS